MIHQRIENLLRLRSYMLQNDVPWQNIKKIAEQKNGWFISHFIEESVKNICNRYLDENELIIYSAKIETAEQKQRKLNIGITMAGNIPLVGFHDFLSVYLSGHQQTIKFSSKDPVLLPHLIEQLYLIDSNNRNLIQSAEMLKNCDAYIATGSNSSALYFKKYFSRFPHIIRQNKTSVAILTGSETSDDLALLADDVYTYFGLGCRNVTKMYVPENYDFVPLLQSFQKYDFLKEHHKYKNNFDYNLAIFILNNQYYMSNDSILLYESESNFSPVAVLHYEYYRDQPEIKNPEQIQAIAGIGHIPFGTVQSPGLLDFSDGIDTIAFLNSL